MGSTICVIQKIGIIYFRKILLGLDVKFKVSTNI
jgi:hypothetical protein